MALIPSSLAENVDVGGVTPALLAELRSQYSCTSTFCAHDTHLTAQDSDLTLKLFVLIAKYSPKPGASVIKH